MEAYGFDDFNKIYRDHGYYEEAKIEAARIFELMRLLDDIEKESDSIRKDATSKIERLRIEADGSVNRDDEKAKAEKARHWRGKVHTLDDLPPDDDWRFLFPGQSKQAEEPDAAWVHFETGRRLKDGKTVVHPKLGEKFKSTWAEFLLILQENVVELVASLTIVVLMVVFASMKRRIVQAATPKEPEPSAPPLLVVYNTPAEKETERRPRANSPAHRRHVPSDKHGSAARPVHGGGRALVLRYRGWPEGRRRGGCAPVDHGPVPSEVQRVLRSRG